MSCDIRSILLDGLRAEAKGNIAKAKANVEVYLHQPVGIGEHPDVLGAIQEQLDIIAHEEERIEVLEKHFINHPNHPTEYPEYKSQEFR